MKTLLEKLKQISEAPYLNDEQLFYMNTSLISSNALNDAYTFLGNVGPSVKVYQKNNKSGIVCGVLDDNENLIHFLDISTSNRALPVEPTQLSSDYFQVGLVMISEELARQGITRAIYSFLIKKFDIVSDRSQYIGAKKLWQSLAINNLAKIFVFDGNINDYIRDKDGKIIHYDGQNIQEDLIWGKSNQHFFRLLVASNYEKH